MVISVASTTDMVATEVVAVLDISQNTVSPELFIVWTIVFIPRACVTVPAKSPAVIVPVAVLVAFVSVFVTVAVPAV